MRRAPAELISLFEADQPFEQFDLYTFTLTSGYVLRYADANFDVVWAGETYLCGRNGGIILDQEGDSGPRAKWRRGLDVGSWSLTVMPREVDKIGDLPWSQAVKSGILDEAMVSVDRGYVLAWPNPPTLAIVPIGVINVFYGRVATIDFGRSSQIININNPCELLAIQIPRNPYSAQCRYALFDTGCSLIKSAFAIEATVTGVSQQDVNTSAVTQADGYFSLGEIEFISGGNAGLRMMIRSHVKAGGLMSLLQPMPFTILNGDQVKLYPGCNKTLATCDGKFNNKLNYGGEPFIPAAENAV